MGCLFRDIYIILSVIGDPGPPGWLITPARIPEGMKLAPWSRIPYNPRALNQRIIPHVVSVSDLEKFAEEAGSR
jgi:hypothetical protein